MRTFLLAAALYLPLGMAFAQTSGSITGEVKDQSGAVAPNAAVTVTNSETNVARSTITNADGIYSFPDLTPGIYQIKVAAAGFANIVRSNIELQVQQTARVDFSLTLGQANQTIEVTSSSGLLSTENATVGTVIEEKRISELPLNGRNFFSLVALAPNVAFGFLPAQQASGRLGGTRSTLTMSLSGTRATWANYTLDGITNTDVDFNTYILLPSAGKRGRSTSPPNRELTLIMERSLSSSATTCWTRGPTTSVRALAVRRTPRRPVSPIARINTALRWGARSGFRRFSTERIGFSSCRTSKVSNPARQPRRLRPP
jgi:Carboxypeptidase regulatory-like domain